MNMNEITVPISKLLPILKENKQKHDNIYETAVSGYWQKAEEVLIEHLDKVRQHQEVPNVLGIHFPKYFGDEYDKVIGMLELTNEDSVTISPQEYDSYVRNKWSWRETFLNSNTCYISGCFEF